MKKLLMIIFVFAFISVSAQDEDTDDEKPFFSKEKLFVGGDFGIFFGGNTFSVGLSPFIGYSINQYVDVAISTNFNYQSTRNFRFDGDVVRNTIYGPGAFVRLFPVDFLYVQGQFERNFLAVKYIPPSNSGFPIEKFSLAASSYLVGAGYSNGRQGTGSPYYYFSVLFDLGDDPNSPYIDQFGRKDPVIRAGFNFPLFGSGNNGSSSRREARRSRRDD